MKKSIIISVLSFFIIVSTSFAFDGSRTGFVIGGGMGFGPYNSYKIGNNTESGNGLGANFLLGYAWNNKNMIVFEVNGNSYRINGLDASNSINIFSWYHYFGETGKSFYSVASLGLYSFYLEDLEFDPDYGYMIGCGYEFARHWQIGAYISGGYSETNGEDYNLLHVNILISTIAF